MKLQFTAFLIGLIFFSFSGFAQPVITSFSPTTGTADPPGNIVTITGFGFGSGPGTLQFKTRASTPEIGVASIISWTDTEIRCYLPNGASSGPIQITTKNQLSYLSPNEFSVPFRLLEQWYDPSEDCTIDVYLRDEPGFNYPHLSRSNVASAIQTAIGSWNNGKNCVRFVYKGILPNPAPTSKFVLLFSAVLPNVENIAEQHAGISDYNGVRVDGQAIVINGDVIMTQDKLIQALTHEFGHVLGLGDLYGPADMDKIMYGISKNHTVTTPSEADLAGVEKKWCNGLLSPTNICGYATGKTINLSWQNNGTKQTGETIFKSDPANPDLNSSKVIGYIATNTTEQASATDVKY